MSSVVISGDTSGAITLAAPAVSGTNTVTLPAATGTVMVSGAMPAFSVYSNVANQSISSNVETKVQLNTKVFDTNANFDNITNYRFTPTVAGYYQINAQVRIALTAGATGFCYAVIYKNGSAYKLGNTSSLAYASGATFTASDLIFCNGSTDYIELYGNVTGVSPSFFYTNPAVCCSMSGCLVRTA